MLLKGATLLAEPCPYCKGVRVMKDGHALCVNCGKAPQIKNNIEVVTKSEPQDKNQKLENSTLSILEQKLATLSDELKNEKDYERQQQILKSISSLVEIIEKLKKSQ